MSHIINVEVSDETYRILTNEAKHMGGNPSILVTRLLESHYSDNTLLPVGPGRENSFESLFGSIDLGYPTGTDNLQIDKDLEKVYGG